MHLSGYFQLYSLAAGYNSQDAMVMNVAYNVVSDKPRDNAEQMEDAKYVEVRASWLLNNNSMHH